ncbi:MAG: cytochrome C [Rhodospirillaceae bacterium]|nr:cytochrome C [Rhodospirillaceae bacterium]
MASEKKKRNNQNTFWHWIWIATLVAAAVVGYLALDGDGACCADPENTAQVALGAELYVTHCAECHEANLEEDWNWQTPLGDGGLRAPPHDESGHTWHHTDDYLFAYTKNGGKEMVSSQFKSDMPGFAEKLSDADIWAVLAYIKSRWPRHILLRQEQLNRHDR